MAEIVLSAQHLTKCYGALTAVENLSLEVRQGEVFGLLGPNGAGKTTSINMLCGLLKPDSGQVFLHGQVITSGERYLRKQVGVCPQDIVLWKTLTCLEQLVFVGSLYGLEAKTCHQRSLLLLEQLDLVGKRDAQARTLSGGMQRRLNLALALVHDPSILVMDEPEAGLDPQSRVLVRDFVRAQAQRKTIILTTHNMDEAERMADRVAIIDHGRLLRVDSPEALKRTVGEGDVLEIELTEGSAAEAGKAIASLVPEVSTNGQMLTIRRRGIVELLPELLEALHRKGIQLGEVKLRPNSLEDVFISLTGRRLRE